MPVWNLSWCTDTESTLLQTITLHTMDIIVALEYNLTTRHFPSTVPRYGVVGIKVQCNTNR